MHKDEIKNIRTKAKMTRTQFAAYMGCTTQTIRNWEEGRAKPHLYFQKALKDVNEFEKSEADYNKEKRDLVGQIKERDSQIRVLEKELKGSGITLKK